VLQELQLGVRDQVLDSRRCAIHPTSVTGKRNENSGGKKKKQDIPAWPKGTDAISGCKVKTLAAAGTRSIMPKVRTSITWPSSVLGAQINTSISPPSFPCSVLLGGLRTTKPGVYALRNAPEVNATMLSVRIEGEPVSAEGDRGAKGGFKARHCLDGSAWDFLSWRQEVSLRVSRL
jgi:hypothetical protein